MNQSAFKLNDLIVILRRRKMQFLIPGAVVFFISIGIAFGLPPLYQSKARILVEQQEIPEELLSSTVQTYAAERIATLKQHIMSFEQLKALAREANLLSKNSSYNEEVEVVKRIKNNTRVEPVYAEVTDPRTGRSRTVTIAFDIFVSSGSPKSAQIIGKELVELYLNLNKKFRIQQANSSAKFFEEEAQRLSSLISKLEAEYARFKEKNVARLPEMMGLNMSLLERVEDQYEEIEKTIRELKEQRTALAAQLSQTQPHSGESPVAHLKTLQMELFNASSKYSPNHPDIARLEREIAILKDEIGNEKGESKLIEKLVFTRDELAKARTRYSEQHPDVIRLKNEVATLEDALREIPEGAEQTSQIKPDNPAYISIKAQLDAVDIQLASEKSKRVRVQKKLNELERRIQQMPQVEQKALELKRNYENAVKKYQEIKDKQLNAQIATQMEEEGKGEHFVLIAPPQLAEEPSSPNRPAILFLGIVLSFSSGVGLVALTEYLDQKVRGIRGVKTIFTSPPLGIIPYTENSQDRRRQRRVRIYYLLIALLGIGLMFTFIYFVRHM
ncbi:lipopolysaccharide biosynthesis protein [Nitrosococcus halophilus Nc 4]|uniref:Lipopolysaccharide biosynthesis protein n=1 Tax=Nitrosococcus halophilus (strain Nc4) TaxID=472759 RepID=D5C0Q0_NITHN|nr:Wzz/FepE/Etk N-terminal domain-containing protein [Nitrosococcus halophilus]ADE16373.1 lipopolysaccharide biosynthesis protein [Nitrosococcus halophilus Nc 4]